MQLILGSQSPRRAEILHFFSLPFQQVSPPFREETISFTGDVRGYIQQLAEGKGTSLLDKYREDAILSADTLVILNNRIFGKPSDLNEALLMLRTLCGQWHSVITAVSLTTKNGQKTKLSETRVLLQPLTEEQMHSYIHANQTFDKAGAYAIQGKGSILVEKIEGCFYNVMGLPLQPVARLLKTIGMNLWDYLD